jgi:hypothetical protein
MKVGSRNMINQKEATISIALQFIFLTLAIGFWGELSAQITAPRINRKFSYDVEKECNFSENRDSVILDFKLSSKAEKGSGVYEETFVIGIPITSLEEQKPIVLDSNSNAIEAFYYLFGSKYSSKTVPTGIIEFLKKGDDYIILLHFMSIYRPKGGDQRRLITVKFKVAH